MIDEEKRVRTLAERANEMKNKRDGMGQKRWDISVTRGSCGSQDDVRRQKELNLILKWWVYIVVALPPSRRGMTAQESEVYKHHF
jgi:hypothetical protein